MSEPTTRPVLVIDDVELFGTLAVFEEILSEQPIEEDEEAPAPPSDPTS
jgi:hypothetical protein